MDDTELIEMGSVLKDNNTMKKLNLYLGLSITTGGWEALTASLSNNNTLVELDLSDNNLSNEGVASLMGVLANNSTLKTLRLENLGNVTRDGFRTIPNIYIETPTCALQNLYLGGNIFDRFTSYHLFKACIRRGPNKNRTLKNLCVTLPANSDLNTPRELNRTGWNPWMNLLMNGINKQESIIETYNSNHVLETICYPQEEARFESAMSTCTTIAKYLPSALQMNREPDKFSVARRKILQNHYFDQEVITKNREQSDYKTLLETIVEASSNLEKTEQLPNMMAWVGRDIDGLSLMYELMQKMPSLCENVVRDARLSKRKR